MESHTLYESLPDRRWHPIENPLEWAHATRQAIFDSSRRCIAHAMTIAAKPGADPDEFFATDDTFRELHICVMAYARGFYALGRTEAGALSMILAAGEDAALPGRLHPAIALAMEQWCHEARASS